MRGGMHHADGREYGAPRASRHPLHGRFPPRTEAAQRARALGSLRGDLALPVRGPVGTDDLTRATPHRVPIVAERSHVHRRAQRGHLGHAHADAEVGARDLEAGRPAIVEYLLASAHDDVGHDVLGTCDVPHDPRERVEILSRAYPHLLVRETGEGPVRDGERVATHRGRVYGAVLFEEKVACVHAVQPPGFAGTIPDGGRFAGGHSVPSTTHPDGGDLAGRTVLHAVVVSSPWALLSYG